MKKPKNKIIILLTGLSVILCACPGVTLLVRGLSNLAETLSRFTYVGQLTNNETISLLLNIGSIGLSGILLLVPTGLAIYLLVQRSKKPPLEPLEPTGISEEDPIPPTH